MNKLVKQAFTLIELLVVIAIIGILSGLIVVSMGGMTQKANVAKLQVFSSSLRNSLLLNLVAEWKFDELSTATEGTVVRDSWSGINNGSLDINLSAADSADKLKSGTDCVSGKCLYFDGVDDYVGCGNNDKLKNLSSLTLEMWYNPADIVNRRNILDKFTYTESGWEVRVENSRLLFLVSQPTQVGITSTSYLKLNNWNHIMCTFAGNGAGASIAKMYLNGNLEASNSSLSPLIPSSVQVGISVGSTNGGAYGLIDDVRIYDSAATISEVKEQYYTGLNSLLASGNITNEEYRERINSIAKK